MSETNSYKQIIKATSIFGGVQVFNIFISLLRSKVVAVLLGPSGMGIVGLLTSTISLIASITNFGLGASAVRDIAAAYATADRQRVSIVTAVFRKWVWVTGILGALVVLIGSPWLSELTFGNRNYTSAFILLSITLLLNQLNSGQNVLLQGSRKLKLLASANMIGAVVSLIVTLPLYYFYGSKGIVPAMVIMSLLTLVVTHFFASRLDIPKAIVSSKTILSEGKGMLRLGFMLSVSGLITTLAAYLVRIYISNTGSITDVGLYSAGFAIIGTYVGMIFSAMGTDYYPRLSGVSHDVQQTNILVNQQAEIALLILGPVLAIFLTFSSFIVALLYSDQFSPVYVMIAWASLGMYFKASSWAVAFIILAKSDSKLFFLNELTTNIYGLFLNILGYYFFGLEGLGISFFLLYLFYFIQVFLVCKNKYAFKFQSKFLKMAIQQFTIGMICFSINRYLTSPYSYVFGVAGCLISIAISFRELNRLFDLRRIVNKILKRK